LANFDENYKIYSKEVLLNEINWIIDYDKLSGSCNDLYLSITFLRQRDYN